VRFRPERWFLGGGNVKELKELPLTLPGRRKRRRIPRGFRLGKSASPADTAYSDRMSTPVEKERINAEAARTADWKRWALIYRAAMGDRSERTIRRREIPGLLPHDHARSRAYRWAKMAYSASLIADADCASHWHCGMKKDPILKERLFGLTNPQGNHGED